MSEKIEIDDSLYSRQRYVLGDEAMVKMAKSSVFLYGLGGIGVEIAKNLVLAGIKKLIIQDPTICKLDDLASQFFIRQSDIDAKKTRAEASLPRLSELNPYVSVSLSTEDISEVCTSESINKTLNCITESQCVILTGCKLRTIGLVDDFCRNNNIRFISCDVYGILGALFCDFGDNFTVFDTNGEEPVEVFIGDVSTTNPGVMTTVDGGNHGLGNDDVVVFKEMAGMPELNGYKAKVKVLSTSEFSVPFDTTSLCRYTGGGQAVEVKEPVVLHFQSFVEQCYRPKLSIPDLSKFQYDIEYHLAYLTLMRFITTKDRLPQPGDVNDFKEFMIMTPELVEGLGMEPSLPSLLEGVCETAAGTLAPLCAFFGGVAAQEALKALTGKFTPISQWLYMDCLHLVPPRESRRTFVRKNDRYDPVRICIGSKWFEKLSRLRLFMVGCGAIGCELMKNLCLLGACTASCSPDFNEDKTNSQCVWPESMAKWRGGGRLTVTDNDLIERSNLNRQFLFRSHHIRCPKSVTAAQAALEMNPDIRVTPHQNKVCSATEKSAYPDSFFQSKVDICLNALDNIEARRYMDARCLTNGRPLLESGTLSTKGHVQVIVPRITETYSSHRDPPEKQVAYCTLKSFPSIIQHCIEWAREKFESQFSLRPETYRKFWSSNGFDALSVIRSIQENQPPQDLCTMTRLLKYKPANWPDCVRLARLKFQKHFNYKARVLLHAFPLETKMEDGSLFWQFPKKPPTPIEFSIQDPLHLLYLRSCAQLFAIVASIPVSQTDMDSSNLALLLANYQVPEWKPASKKIVTDQKVEKREEETESADDYEMARRVIEIASGQDTWSSIVRHCEPLAFEKDDDSNGHIDYITAAANLRARMYRIEEADRLHVKKIAGKIAPAIATTTASVAGLVMLELLKLVDLVPPDADGSTVLRNAFLNLSLPVFLLSEPGPCRIHHITDHLSFTGWDRWEVLGGAEFTLQNFIDVLKAKYGLNASLVVHGNRLIYVPGMPGHSKRLVQQMTQLLKVTPEDTYVDLVVSYEMPVSMATSWNASTSSEDGDEEDSDIQGPPVRYFPYDGPTKPNL